MVSGEEVRQRMQALEAEKGRRKRLLTLRKEALRRAEYLRERHVIDPHDVYALVKDFFKGFTDRTYEFTIPELREELRHVYLNHQVRSHIHDLLEVLHKLEYANVTYTREQLIAMLDLFRSVVHEAVRAQVQRKGVFVRLKEFLWAGEPEPDVIISELPAIEAPDAERVALSALAEKCYAALDKHDVRRANAAYKAMLATYHRLPAAHQRAHYVFVDQAFRDLQNRMRAGK